MIKARRLGWVLAIIAALGGAQAQEAFPSRPITVVVPFPPGGSADPVMRMIGQKMSESIKQTIVIDNKGGGGGNPAAKVVKQASPDGYTLFMGNVSTHAVNPALYPDLGFDPVKDFQPITLLLSFPSVLVVPAGSPAKSIAELAALAKSKPGGLSYASQGVGSGGHLLGEMLRARLGVPMVHVPYRGAGPAVQDLIGGRVDLLFASYISSGPAVEAGTLRILAITSPKRSPILPNVPTMAESGFAGVELDVWYGMMAPAGTPAPVVRYLHDAFVTAAQSPEVQKMMAPQAANVVTSTPEEFAALITADIVRLGKVVRDAGNQSGVTDKMPMKFHHLHLKSRDPEKAVAWYERAFGFTVADKVTRPAGDLFITCKTTDGTMVIISGAKTGEALRPGDAGLHLGLEHFAVATDDFDRDFAHLKSVGAQVLAEPFTTPTGIRFAFVQGPDDVRIELMFFPKG